MESDSLLNTTKIFDTLVKGHEIVRQKAQRSLDDPKIMIDKPNLRLQILNALDKDFYPGVEKERDDDKLSWTRAWLLATLARVCEDDTKSAKVLRKHLDPKYEPDHWVRFWTLEGLIVSKTSDIISLAKEIKSRNDNKLVDMLATAILASKTSDKDALQKIRNGLEKNELKTATLRALLIIPLPGTVTRICKIIDEESKFRLLKKTYIAINALGKIPYDWPEAKLAARRLVIFIEENRRSPMYDSMRIKALTSLGDLEIKNAIPILIEELTDENPAIICEAAKALEKIAGIKVTTERVVEAASIAGVEQIEKYASAFRYMNRDAITNELGVIMTSGSMDSKNIAQILLSEMGGAAAYKKLEERNESMKNFQDFLKESDNKIKERYNELIKGAEKGFDLVTAMDSIVFGLGMVLIIISALIALFNEGSLIDWIGIGLSGPFGILGTLYGMFYTKPRNNIKNSVKNLSFYYILFQGYTHELHQIYQAFTLHLIDERELTTKKVIEYNEMVEKTMREAILQLSKIKIET